VQGLVNQVVLLLRKEQVSVYETGEEGKRLTSKVVIFAQKA
jgi:hypothetical protein